MPARLTKKSRVKGYEVSGERRITQQVLHETKEKGKLKRLLKKLIHIRKGH
jgi:hypothetical protein